MISILIPVLGRGHLIAPLVENIHQATVVEHEIVFICTAGDSAESDCIRSGEWTISVEWEPGRGDFAKKINHAYGRCESDWFFQGATDLRFVAGWDEEALRVAKAWRSGVIGTNDLGNPLVTRGQSSTHTMFSREYIEKFGGTFDDSGIVFSEQYDHQFVDTEFVELAKLRKQFRAARRSVVEHLHPHWNKGEMDSTYEKAIREFAEDRSLYMSRMREARLSAGIRRR